MRTHWYIYGGLFVRMVEHLKWYSQLQGWYQQYLLALPFKLGTYWLQAHRQVSIMSVGGDDNHWNQWCSALEYTHEGSVGEANWLDIVWTAMGAWARTCRLALTTYLIWTGVGSGFNPPRHLKPGDTIRIKVEGIGELHNHVEWSYIQIPPSKFQDCLTIRDILLSSSSWPPFNKQIWWSIVLLCKMHTLGMMLRNQLTGRSKEVYVAKHVIMGTSLSVVVGLKSGGSIVESQLHFQSQIAQANNEDESENVTHRWLHPIVQCLNWDCWKCHDRKTNQNSGKNSVSMDSSINSLALQDFFWRIYIMP